MLAYGQVYTKVLNKAIKDALRKANTHNVLELYQRDTRFLAQETINPREDQPAGRFHAIMVDAVRLCSSTTCERSAIEAWFDDGNRADPETKEVVEDTGLT
ncbi:hypothetical protein JHK85_004972 [Glycine max]|nr:hypothetical protein JHK85_004972 [Glycine max]